MRTSRSPIDPPPPAVDKQKSPKFLLLPTGNESNQQNQRPEAVQGFDGRRFSVDVQLPARRRPASPFPPPTQSICWPCPSLFLVEFSFHFPLFLFQPICVKDCDRTGKTALHYCAENTSPDVAQLLLKSDAGLVNQPDEEGYTPLHLAVIAGNRIMLRYLLDHGAEVNLLDNERHSVVHWATVCGELEALDVVLDSGAEASVEDIHGAYPVHYAAQMCGSNKKTLMSMGGSGSGGKYTGLSALKKLISRGVPVDVIDRDGRQPLLWAASSG